MSENSMNEAMLALGRIEGRLINYETRTNDNEKRIAELERLKAKIGGMVMVIGFGASVVGNLIWTWIRSNI